MTRRSPLLWLIRSHPSKRRVARSEISRCLGGKAVEVVDRYDPDLVWFDFGLDLIQQWYKKHFAEYYFNRAAARDKEVIITYKNHDMTPGAGVYDLELGQETEMTYAEWITDTTIDAGSGWGYISDLGFKSVNELVTGLVDRVSKNGFLLLNVGPKPDGTIPEPARERLKQIGDCSVSTGKQFTAPAPGSARERGPRSCRRAGRSTRIIPSGTLRRTFASPARTILCTLRFWHGRARKHRLPASCLMDRHGRVCIPQRLHRSRCWAATSPSSGSSRRKRWN